jgi:hypothetical protein
MLSGKSQYYNSVRKESFKAMNSVTFCAGTKGTGIAFPVLFSEIYN